MFRLILLAAREVERTGDWGLPLSYFAFWTVRLGAGWRASTVASRAMRHLAQSQLTTIHTSPAYSARSAGGRE